MTPVLKWVKSEQEAEVRAAFEKTLAVRALSARAKDLADMCFFETLVRLHRAGEGAPCTAHRGQGEPAEAPGAHGEGSGDGALAWSGCLKTRREP